MLRPASFSQPHIAFRNTPYLDETASRPAPDDTSGPNLLTQGQIVWTRSRFALGDMPARTVAFVEELGLISLDPRWLVPADLPAPAPAHLPGRAAPAPTPSSTLRRVS